MERVIRRAAQLMKQDPNEDVRAQGGIDLATIQKWVNHWYSYSLDLFGAEVSTNAADYFASGLKGRWRESKDYDEHSALGQVKVVPHVVDGKITDLEVPLRNAMNEELRDSYIKDCSRVVKRWNRHWTKKASPTSDELPHRRFHRHQGSIPVITSTCKATWSTPAVGMPSETSGSPPTPTGRMWKA